MANTFLADYVSIYDLDGNPISGDGSYKPHTWERKVLVYTECPAMVAHGVTHMEALTLEEVTPEEVTDANKDATIPKVRIPIRKYRSSFVGEAIEVAVEGKLGGIIDEQIQLMWQLSQDNALLREQNDILREQIAIMKTREGKSS